MLSGKGHAGRAGMRLCGKAAFGAHHWTAIRKLLSDLRLELPALQKLAP
jgi:hypothetical protein